MAKKFIATTTEVTYITKCNGYAGLLAAIIEQARHDANNGDTDALAGIEEWHDVLFGDNSNPLQSEWLNDREHAMTVIR